MVRNPPAMQEAQVQSQGREDPVENGMAIHSSILAWRIPWMEEPSRLQSIGSPYFPFFFMHCFNIAEYSPVAMCDCKYHANL